MNIDKEYLQHILKDMLAIDSPAPFTESVIVWLKNKAEELGYKTQVQKKGNLVIYVDGREKGKKVGLCAHADTLGCMVRSIGSNGEIRFTRIGGALTPSLDGEECRIYTREGKVYTGTFLSNSPSCHVFDDAHTLERKEDKMWVRLDEIVKTAADVKALGIRAGDIIAIEPHTQITPSGFVKSRFLDDKASVACFFAALKYMSDNKLSPKYDTEFFVTVFEEVGHGGAPIGEGLDEMVAVDMGCIGLDLTCTEYDVSICAKDAGGPYNYEMVTRLDALCEKNGISRVIDIYPHYGSDVGAMLRAGHDVRGALIGPGIQASHGTERTHTNALLGTVKLICAYLEV